MSTFASSHPTIHTARAALRRSLRQARRALTPAQQQQHAQQLSRQLNGCPWVKQRRRIAVYSCHDGEIDLSVWCQSLCADQAQLYLPVLHPDGSNRLYFARYHADAPLRRNRFGIIQPQQRVLLPAWALDMVLLPLVAFDPQGNRLGMGGGFYDRTFAFLQRQRLGPRLIGVAHQLQCVAQLPTQNWDIPLSAIVTDHRLYKGSQQTPVGGC